MDGSSSRVSLYISTFYFAFCGAVVVVCVSVQVCFSSRFLLAQQLPCWRRDDEEEAEVAYDLVNLVDRIDWVDCGSHRVQHQR